VFFQWIQCSAIWIAGCIVQLARGSPQFEPFAMIGGMLWCTGNITVVSIVKMIGLSLGILVWGTVNLIAGWASGTFGLFGLHKESVPHPTLNYIGVAFAVCAVIVMIGIKTETKSKVDDPSAPSSSASSGGKQSIVSSIGGGSLLTNAETVPLLVNPVSDYEQQLHKSPQSSQDDSWVEKLSMQQRRVFGIVLAVLSGVLYGVNFDPPQYIMDHNPDKSQNGLDYVFSHFSGIYVMSTFYLILYCIIRRNRPSVFPSAILPGFVCGFLWAVAQISWFFANNALSLVVSFPIISTGPGIVASLWGIFAFREISGVKNYLVLAAAIGLTVVSSVLTSLSALK